MNNQITAFNQNAPVKPTWVATAAGGKMNAKTMRRMSPNVISRERNTETVETARLGVSPVLVIPLAAHPTMATSAPAGNDEVAPVYILGMSAISVASPVVNREANGPEATERATLIEGNLSLIHSPRRTRTACTPRFPTLVESDGQVVLLLLHRLQNGAMDGHLHGEQANLLLMPNPLLSIEKQPQPPGLPLPDSLAGLAGAAAWGQIP